jgi:serine/threonine-protein kinase 11
MRLSSPVASPTVSPKGSPISTPIGTRLGMLVQTPTVDLGDDTDVTYQTVDKGPKKINQYILGEKLGQGTNIFTTNSIGSYAKVREAIDSNTLKRVAVKIMKLRVMKKITGAMAALNREINIMRKLKHKV